MAKYKGVTVTALRVERAGDDLRITVYGRGRQGDVPLATGTVNSAQFLSGAVSVLGDVPNTTLEDHEGTLRLLQGGGIVE